MPMHTTNPLTGPTTTTAAAAAATTTTVATTAATAATIAVAATTAATAASTAVAARCDIATTTAAPPPTTPPPAAPLSFARRARGALCGHEARSVELRFCVPMVALVGFQMGVGFAWGFIYLKQGLHASGLVIGCSPTFQAAIEVPPSPLGGLQPHASRLQPYASSLQAHAPQPPATLCLQVPLFRISAWLICAFGGVRTTLLTTSLAGAIRMAGWWALLTMAALAVAALAVAVLTVALLWLY